jgi:hypothetical protein
MGWFRSDERRQTRVDRRLDAIRIFTAELELDGYVAPTGQRITDILLRGQDLPFLPAGADEAPENWVLVSPSHTLVVIPPPLPGGSHWVDPGELIGMFVEVGPYQVVGTAHMRKGDVPDAEFPRRQPFLPLTDATIMREGSSHQFEVAIVNLSASVRVEPTDRPRNGPGDHRGGA